VPSAKNILLKRPAGLLPGTLLSAALRKRLALDLVKAQLSLCQMLQEVIQQVKSFPLAR